MNRPKSTAATQEIKEQSGDTSLDGPNLLGQVPGENPQMSSTLCPSTTAANNSADDSLPKVASVEKGTLLEQFNQLMNQRHLLWSGEIDKLQQKMEERNDEVRKKYEGWLLGLSDMEVKVNKAREEIEAIRADNCAVLASIASTSGNISDDRDLSLLTDGHCPISSSNLVPLESLSNASSSPPETLQTINVNVSNINKEHLDEQQLNNEDTIVDDVTSNIEKGGEKAGTDLDAQERENSTNYSNDRTVAQSFDLFAPSTSTGRGTNPIALYKQANVSTYQNSPNGNQPNRTVKKSKKTFVDDGGKGEDRNVDREEEKTKVLHLNCTETNCNSKLETMNLLYDHLRTVHGLGPYRCFASNCTSRFDNRAQIREHFQMQHHPQSTEFRCPVCPKEFDSQTKTVKHWYNMHLNGQFQCKFVNDCVQVTNTRNEMTSHQVKQHYSQLKHLHCTQRGCSASFAFACLLKAHESTHLNRKSFHCDYPQCSHSTVRLAGLIVHIRVRHFGLPATVKEQNEKNIVDGRDPNEYVRLVNDVIAQ